MAGVGHGAGAARPSARHGGKRNREKGIRMADGWGPHGSETRRKVGDNWAGCLWWAEMHRRAGGLVNPEESLRVV
jgi:hypothetical protein